MFGFCKFVYEGGLRHIKYATSLVGNATCSRHGMTPRAEPVVIHVFRGKVATQVGTFLVKSMNLVPTFPHGPQICRQSYRKSTYLVATFQKSSNLVPTLNVRTFVLTLYVL
jgi:hypothetical protein